MTEYVVFMALDIDDPEQPNGGPTFFPLPGTVTAANDVAAIKAKAKADGIDLSKGAAAVPARSWRPRTREVKMREQELWT